MGVRPRLSSLYQLCRALMMEAENNPVNSASESQPERNDENEVEVKVKVLRLKKYGCEIRMVDWVSALGWYGLALSVLGFFASIGLMLTTLMFQWVCGSGTTCSSMTVATGVISMFFSLLWIIFSVTLLKRKHDWHTTEFKELVKTGCFVIACIQIIVGGYFFTTSTISLGKMLDIQAIPVTFAADTICILGSLALITFSCLLIYGVQWNPKKTKLVQAYFIFSLFLD